MPKSLREKNEKTSDLTSYESIMKWFPPGFKMLSLAGGARRPQTMRNFHAYRGR
jgi:hypothetical protein